MFWIELQNSMICLKKFITAKYTKVLEMKLQKQ